MDPIVAVTALAGAVSTLATVVYRLLIHRAERAEQAETFWRDRALTYLGMADIAADEAEKRRRPR